MRDLVPGTQVERYVVESRIGAGRVSTTYRVRHVTLDSLHALTVPNETHRGLLSRMVAGARIQSRLRHPGIVSVTDVLDLDAHPALILDHVDGPTLEEFVDSHALDDRAIDALANGLLDALGWLHGNSVVHRNLKPRTVFVDLAGEVGVPRITDFTLARGAGDQRKRARPRVFGTPQYMAPEQTFDSDAVDHRADLWSLGCLLYRLCAGRPAFPEHDANVTFGLVRAGSYRPLSEAVPGAPGRWARAIDAALQVDPARRVQSADELAARWFEGSAERPKLSAKTAPVGTIALVFTDVQGSTRIWEANSEVARHSLRAHDAVMRAALNRHGGYEVKTEGDSFMVAFHDPAQAVEFCLEVQRDLYRHPWSDELLALPEAKAEPGFRGLRVRMGVHIGEPEARMDQSSVDYFGPMVNRAARISSCGHGGQILLSSRVHGVVRARVKGAAFRPLGDYRLRGLNGTQALVEAQPTELPERGFPPIKAERVGA